MSTTIKYKGSTIATAENETKTLLTAGKYMEGNVIVEDVSSGGNEFIITLTADSQQEKWVPDKTFADIAQAVADGREIALRTDSGGALTDGWWYDEDSCLAYVVYYFIAGNAYIDAYSLYSDELVLDSREQQFTPNFEVKSVTYRPSTVEQHDTLTPSAGYNGIERVDVLIDRVRSAGRTYAALNGSGYITENGQRKWQTRAEFTVGEAGWMSEGFSYGDWEKFPALPSGTAVTPTKQSQFIGAADTMMEGPVTVNPIPAEYIIPSGTKQITENGTGIDVAEFASVDVNVSGGGGGAAEPNDVEYIDYDGTIVYSYSAAEYAQLTAHPANPSHDGLVAQGWNWSLSDAQAYVAEYGGLVIGQMYITASGDTEIDVVMPEGRLSPILTIAVNGSVTVDWGDGTTPNTVTGASLTSRKSVPHTYASTGSYTIKIHVVSGSFTFYGSTSYLILRKNTTTNQNRVYANCVKAVRLGDGITSIGANAFVYCSSLASITIPSGVTSIGAYVFASCYFLASVTIPSGVTSIANNAFDYCTSLASIAIPSGVTSIEDNAINTCYGLASLTIPSGVTSIRNSVFGNCYGLASLTIPSGVTSIGKSAFAGCYGISKYHVKPTIPPTLGTNVFSNIVSDCKIYVPAESLEAYKTASGWSDYASMMVGE